MSGEEVRKGKDDLKIFFFFLKMVSGKEDT